MIDYLAYGATIIIIGCYIYGVWGPNDRFRHFHWSNAVFGPVILASEVAARAWPAFVLTFFFTVVGWMGVYANLKLDRAYGVGAAEE